MIRHLTRRLLLASAALMTFAAPGSATWSIVLIDVRTGEVALGSATCLTNFDMRVSTPVLITGVGGATAQSFVDQTGLNRARIRDGFLTGETPDQILAALALIDTGHQTRQYGFADVRGNTGTFSGTGAGPWAGGRTGRFTYSHNGMTGEIVYAIQGNVLAGPAVVDDAVDAVINTPGDLADRMMAGMQAARLIGGDGRCSCQSGGPACGTPPPGFDPLTDKSAHIGYMFIARTGDVDGCNGLYASTELLYGVTLHDVNADGRPDALVSGTNNVHLFLNTSSPEAPLASFAPATILAASNAQSRRIQFADVTGDGREDIVLAASQAGEIHILPGLGSLTFGPTIAYATGGSPLLLNLADFNGDMIPDPYTVTGNTATLAIALSNGLGGHTLVSTALPSAAQGADALDLDNDGDMDLAVALQSTDQVQFLLNDGTGGFALSALLATGDEPIDVLATDFDLDGDIDLLTANRNGRSLSIFTRDGGVFTPSTLPLSRRPRLLRAGDIDGDARPDIVIQNVALEGGSTVLNTPGGFAESELFSNPPASDIAAADLNADGLVDIVAPAGSNPMAVNTNSGDPRQRFASIAGCAAGDYFLSLNIANQSAAAPDPVIQLQNQFDDWRLANLARPDAVVSEAALNAPGLAADGTATATLQVTLRDWNLQPVSTPVAFSLRTHRGSQGEASLGAVTPLGNGMYEIEFIAGNISGLNRFDLVVDDGVRPVTLMPPLDVRLKDARGDFNADGFVDRLDLPAFIDAFVLDSSRADLTGSSDPADTAYGMPDGQLDASDLFFLLDLIES